MQDDCVPSLQEIAEQITYLCWGTPWVINCLEIQELTKAELPDFAVLVSALHNGLMMQVTSYTNESATPISLMIFSYKDLSKNNSQARDLTKELIACYKATRHMRSIRQHVLDIRKICKGS